MVCPKCGQVARNDSKICALCGTPLKRERRPWLTVLIGLLVLAALAAGGIFLLPKLGVDLPDFLPIVAQPSPAPAAEPDAVPASAEMPEATAPLAEPDPEDLLWTGAVQIQAAPHYALGLTAEGRVLLAGPETEIGRLDVADWADVRQLVPLEKCLAGLTGEGKVLLTGDTAAFEAARDWDPVERLVASAGSLFGLTRDGRLFGAGPGMYFNTASLRDVADLLPCYADSLVLFQDGSTRFIPHLGMFSNEGQLRDVADLVANSDCGLFLMKDGTVRLSSHFRRTLETYYREDPFADWQDLRQLCLADSYALGLTRDGRVLSATWL